MAKTKTTKASAKTKSAKSKASKKSSAPKTALVTGATGFIGSFVAEMLRERGFNVRLLVRNERRLRAETRDGCEVIKGDVTQSPEALKPAVEGCDYVFHVAGLIKGRTQNEFNRVNAYGAKNLVDASVNAGVNGRFLMVSSLAAIGPNEGSHHVVTEDTIPHPQTFYGRSKLLGEKFAFASSDQMPVTVIRPPAVYGPRDTGILEFFQFMARGYALQFGNEERTFSLIHGRDLARGIIEAALHDATIGEAYFLTNPEPYPMSWTMAMLREILKPSKNRTLKGPVWLAKLYARWNDVFQWVTGKPMLPNSDKMRELMPLYWVCSGEKAKRDFGFEPEIDIMDGLRETAEFYIDEGWIRVR